MSRTLNVAFYRFVPLTELKDLQRQLKALLVSFAVRGTVLIAPEGFNANLAGEEPKLREALVELEKIPEFSALEWKESFSDEIPFGRTRVRVKKEIIAFGIPEVQPLLQTGDRVKPAELLEWLNSDSNTIMFDTRNEYEIAKGTFKNAVHLGLKHFRDFPKALDEWNEAHASDLAEKRVVMFCTGGIRCEKATAYAQQIGMKNVYQLDGGILKYFEETKGAHYEGKCFVFDYRDAIEP